MQMRLKQHVHDYILMKSFIQAFAFRFEMNVNMSDDLKIAVNNSTIFCTVLTINFKY